MEAPRVTEQRQQQQQHKQQVEQELEDRLGDEKVIHYDLIEKLKEQLLELYISSKDYDILLRINERVWFKAHSSIIVARCKSLPLRQRISQYLSSASPTHSDSKNERHLTISIPQVRIEAVDSALKFMYCGSVSFPSIDIMFDFMVLSTFFGIPSLQQASFNYLEDQSSPKDCSNRSLYQIMNLLNNLILQKAETYRNVTQIEKLTEIFAIHLKCFEAKSDKNDGNYYGMSEDFWTHVLKQDNYDFEEEHLWLLLKKDICYNFKLSNDREISNTELTEKLCKYCEPYKLRILNFDTKFFASEVQPFNVYDKQEVVLKYRFDALAGLEPNLDNAFLMDRENLLKRIRRRTLIYQCENHPYKKGFCYSTFVRLPVWISQFVLDFDQRTTLGRYAQLNFFTDSSKSQQLLKIISPNLVVDINHQFITRSNSNLESMTSSSSYSLPCTLSSFLFQTDSFFFTFYSPSNVGEDAWGYKFSVSPIL